MDAKQAAILGEPINFKGLNVYPMVVGQYKLWQACESALMLRLSALPAVYASKPYAQALFAMSRAQTLNDHYKTMWVRFMWAFCLSLKIQPDKHLTLVHDKSDPTALKAVVVIQNERTVRLEISELGELRRIMAELNGRELPDEADNMELVEAEEAVLSASSLNLKLTHEDLLAAVARDQRIRIKDLMQWTIFEFELIRSALERERRFTVCGMGEMSGNVKWPNGNPYPSLFFDRVRGNAGIVNADDLQRRLGGAVQQTNQIPNLPV